jgi:alpha-tubulin suppressor-like RCC1 family protein
LAQTPWTHFAVTQTGDVYGWGSTIRGSLGGGSEDGGASCGGIGPCAGAIQKNPTLKNIRRLAATRYGGLAIDGAGKVWAWGWNAAAQLGHLPGTSGDVKCSDGEYCQLTPIPFVGLP